MDRGRHSRKHSTSKSKKTGKKKRSRDENGSGPDNIKSVSSSVIKPLVEYSDVSSEDLSEPEAGEIQSEGSRSISDGEISAPSLHKIHARKSLVISDDRDSYRHLSNRKTLVLPNSPSRRSRLDSSFPRTPSPHHERKHSLSSDVSRNSSSRHRKKHETSPLPVRQVVSSPPLNLEEYDLRRHRKKKEKRHKRDKKSTKKKKRKSKHRSRSSSVDNVSDHSPKTSPPSRQIDLTDGDRELSDWEQQTAPSASYHGEIVDQVDLVTCSPVSPPSSGTSPDCDDNQVESPGSYSPPVPPQKKLTESPHTPLLPPKAYEDSKDDDVDLEGSSYSGRKQLSPALHHTRSSSPSGRFNQRVREPSWTHHQSLSPVKSSPFRNPSPDVQIVSGRDSMSPSRKRRRVDRESSHRRHRKEKEQRLKDRRRLSRSRSPIRRHRSSRSPSWNRGRHYSRSNSRTRTSKKYKSRSPKRISSPRSPHSRYVYLIVKFKKMSCIFC